MGSVMEGNIEFGCYKCYCFKYTFLVNLDGIDGGGGSSRCYTHAKSENEIEFSEWYCCWFDVEEEIDFNLTRKMCF